MPSSTHGPAAPSRPPLPTTLSRPARPYGKSGRDPRGLPGNNWHQPVKPGGHGWPGGKPEGQGHSVQAGTRPERGGQLFAHSTRCPGSASPRQHREGCLSRNPRGRGCHQELAGHPGERGQPNPNAGPTHGRSPQALPKTDTVNRRHTPSVPEQSAAYGQGCCLFSCPLSPPQSCPCVPPPRRAKHAVCSGATRLPYLSSQRC